MAIACGLVFVEGMFYFTYNVSRLAPLGTCSSSR